MSKPVCKSEARWKFWRTENPKHDPEAGFAKWMKKQMNRAKRRFHKKEIKKILEE